MQIVIYACPTEGCGNYYGSSSARDLTQEITGQFGQNFERRPPEMWHSRAQCPDCRAQGKQVERVPVVLNIEVPAAAQSVAA